VQGDDAAAKTDMTTAWARTPGHARSARTPVSPH